MKKNLITIVVTTFLLFQLFEAKAQSTISFQCKELNLSKSESLKCDPVSEDDPNDLAEAYTLLISYFPETYKGTDQQLELHFPARVATYHWTQNDAQDKNDSLTADLIYNTNPKVYGYTVQAHAKDFTISVTRYDAAKNGVVEGKFEGTMEAYLAWSHQTVLIPVKGNFHTVRNGIGAECRKQRRSEKEVITKAINVFDNTLISSLQNIGWKVNEEQNGLNGVVANHPGPFRPLSLCSPFFELKLSLDPNSDYGKKLQDSAEYYAQQSSQNANDDKALVQATQNMFRIRNMQNISISIDANSPYIKSEYHTGSKDRFTVLHIQSVPYAYQIYQAPSDNLGTPEESTYLCFGKWDGADMHASSYVNYPFVHKQSASAIENFEIMIKAPASVANEIIKKIDWSKMNEALTR